MESYAQQQEREVWDSSAAQDAPASTYRVREHWTILADGFPTLRDAQRWRDRNERKYEGGCLIVERSYPLVAS